MKRSIPIIAFVLVLFLVLPCYGEEKPSEIYFDYLKSPNNNSAMSGRCTGDTSSHEIQCKFWQVRVSLELDPDELPKQLKRLRQESDNWKKEGKNLDDFVKDICKNAGDLEQKLEKDKKENRMAPYELSTAKTLIDLCKNPSYEKLLKFVEDGLIRGTKTCLITFDRNAWTAKFTKVKKNKWVSNEGPTGVCNAFFLFTLEHEPNYNTLWTYTQTRTYADQDELLCKGLEVGITNTWDWRDRLIEMNCQFIDYGF